MCIIGHSRHRLIVMWTAYFQALSFEIDPVKGHGLGRLVDRTELEERKVLVQVDLARQHRIASRLREAREMHLLIEELHHLLLSHSKGDVAHVQAPCLPRNCRSDDRYGRLRGIRYDVGGYLAGCLHSLVLQRSDVFEARWWHVPVERGLPTPRTTALSVRRTGSAAPPTIPW